LLATAFIGAMILYSQSPGTVPVLMRPVFAATEAGMASFAGHPVKSVAQSTSQPAVAATSTVKSWLLAAAGAAAAMLALGAPLFVRRRPLAKASPVWIATARAAVPEGRKPREHAHECDELEKTLVPDIRALGIAALGKAHQLDLYARLVARSKRVQAGRASGAEFMEFSRATLQTLRAVAPATGSIGASPAYRQVRPALSVLTREDAVAVRAFYEGLESKRRDQAAAWQEARAAIEARPADQQKCLAAMERLRQGHRGIATDAAALVGDIEVSVRAAL
jgi:hypothetical protein